MPLWHNSVFKNSKSNTYYCPSLIRTGVTGVSHLCNDALVPSDSIIAKLAATWQPVYRGSLSSYSQLPISLWSLPSTWPTARGTSAFLKKAASSAPADTRQEPQVWASFWTSKSPPSPPSSAWSTKYCGKNSRLVTGSSPGHNNQIALFVIEWKQWSMLYNRARLTDKCWEIPPNAQAVKSIESLPKAKSLKHPAGLLVWVARFFHPVVVQMS